MDIRTVNSMRNKNLSLKDLIRSDLSALCTITGSKTRANNLYTFVNEKMKVNEESL